MGGISEERKIVGKREGRDAEETLVAVFSLEGLRGQRKPRLSSTFFLLYGVENVVNWTGQFPCMLYVCVCGGFAQVVRILEEARLLVESARGLVSSSKVVT